MVICPAFASAFGRGRPRSAPQTPYAIMDALSIHNGANGYVSREDWILKISHFVNVSTSLNMTKCRIYRVMLSPACGEFAEPVEA
jgi:hypothetical protein